MIARRFRLDDEDLKVDYADEMNLAVELFALMYLVSLFGLVQLVLE